eukprot:Amastigsp_a677400_7.p3 type:complete len:135 gc:universal Amastigsp_a677400_7:842-438(-)
MAVATAARCCAQARGATDRGTGTAHILPVAASVWRQKSNACAGSKGRCAKQYRAPRARRIRHGAPASSTAKQSALSPAVVEGAAVSATEPESVPGTASSAAVSDAMSVSGALSFLRSRTELRPRNMAAAGGTFA